MNKSETTNTSLYPQLTALAVMLSRALLSVLAEVDFDPEKDELKMTVGESKLFSELNALAQNAAKIDSKRALSAIAARFSPSLYDRLFRSPNLVPLAQHVSRLEHFVVEELGSIPEPKNAWQRLLEAPRGIPLMWAKMRSVVPNNWYQWMAESLETLRVLDGDLQEVPATGGAASTTEPGEMPERLQAELEGERLVYSWKDKPRHIDLELPHMGDGKLVIELGDGAFVELPRTRSGDRPVFTLEEKHIQMVESRDGVLRWRS